MELRVDGIEVHYAEHGRGVPLVALHGAGVDHREIEAAIEAVLPHDGCRGIYPDLPGMGHTSARGLHGNDDVVALLERFIDAVAGGPVLLLGHSYGASLARGLAARRPERILGLALLCPFGDGSDDPPAHAAVHSEAGAHAVLAPDQRAGFDEYFVVRTPVTARRYRDAVAPGVAAVDEAALERIFSRWELDLGTAVVSAPTLLVAGRRDATVGFQPACDPLAAYRRASLAVIEDAGHALMHERPELLAALLHDWRERAT